MHFLSMNENDKDVSDVTVDNFLQAVQQAIGIEIATIPLYLYTYYSINRTPDLTDLEAELTNRLSDRAQRGKYLDAIEHIDGYILLDDDIKAKFNDFKPKVMDLRIKMASAEDVAHLTCTVIKILANKIAAQIYSVVVEEMLHAALSGNVLSGAKPNNHTDDKGRPRFYGAEILPKWPFNWLGHLPALTLNLEPLSKDVLFSFVDVETPSKLPDHQNLLSAPPLDFTTIGEFYDSIIKVLESQNKTAISYDTVAPKLVPGKGYYAQNNINSIYYNLDHEPVFENTETGGDLIGVTGTNQIAIVDEAIASLNLICEQGEGSDNKWDGKTINAQDVHDKIQEYEKTGDEVPHFYKFQSAYCELSFLEGLGKNLDRDLLSYFVYKTPTNPSLALTYESQPVLLAIATACNAAFNYIFVMLDYCYQPSPTIEQEKVFIGVHKSMMWVISTFCQDLMPLVQYNDQDDGRTYTMAPTFEYFDFSVASTISPKQHVLALVSIAKSAVINSTLPNKGDISTILDHIFERVETMEDVPLPK